MTMPDLAPGVPSRVVTINAVEFAEDAPRAGTIIFSLHWDLRVPTVGQIITAGERVVQLVDGTAQLRLFTDSPLIVDDHEGRRGPRWAIWVKKSWEPCAYPIRVPAGTEPISLAAIPPVASLYRHR